MKNTGFMYLKINTYTYQQFAVETQEGGFIRLPLYLNPF